MRVVGCFLEFDSKFIILLRHSHKPDGNTWGLPGGKIEDGESDEDAIIRELEEETGYKATASQLQHLGDFEFMSNGNTLYRYVTFKIILKNRPHIQLETTAHAKYKWVTAQECYERTDLISDFHNLLKFVGYIQ